MSKDVALKIDHVSKEYRLGAIGGGTLRGDLESWWAKVHGKEDPNSKIGAEKHLPNEKFMALQDVSLTVKKGEAVGIIGHNGAGKSTLLKLICRITGPTEGAIGFDGRITSMLEVGTGFHGELTGRENVYMNGAILGMTRAEISAKMEQIIDFAEIRQFIDTPVKRYSSGMYVKLAFSVAAHLDSEIMIMDEVLAVGDMAFQKKCLEKMREAASTEGRTILYVSHNMNTIRQLCDRVIVLDHGRLVFDGDVEEGIGRYLSETKLSESSVDLSSIERSNMFIDTTVMMDRLIVDTDIGYFVTGSKIKASLFVRSSQNLTGIRLEIPIRDISGQSATRFFSDSCITLKESEYNRIDFTLDTSCLAPGKYTMNPILRENTELGTQINLDGIANAYCFAIVPSEDFNGGVEWSTYFSGYYIAPKIVIDDVRSEV